MDANTFWDTKITGGANSSTGIIGRINKSTDANQRADSTAFRCNQDGRSQRYPHFRPSLTAY